MVDFALKIASEPGYPATNFGLTTGWDSLVSAVNDKARDHPNDITISIYPSTNPKSFPKNPFAKTTSFNIDLPSTYKTVVDNTISYDNISTSDLDIPSTSPRAEFLTWLEDLINTNFNRAIARNINRITVVDDTLDNQRLEQEQIKIHGKDTAVAFANTNYWSNMFTRQRKDFLIDDDTADPRFHPALLMARWLSQKPLDVAA